MQKTWDFSKLMVCPHGQGEGVELVRTSFMDGPLNNKHFTNRYF